MNYQAFTNDSLTMMYQGARGALAVDDALCELALQLPTCFEMRALSGGLVSSAPE
jgi:hypothetical protein